MLCFCVFNAEAQSYNNLVPNSSFEKYDTCPNSYYSINNVIGWHNICNAGASYFNICAVNSNWSVPLNYWGNQYPLCGDAYTQTTGHISVITNREYIGCTLLQPLEPNKEYCVEFSISLAETSSAACDQIGLLLTDSAVICPNTGTYAPVLSTYSPQIVSPKGLIISDTINWTKVSGTFIAHGGEQYLTIGIFVVNDSLNWCIRHPYWSHWYGYFIDNVKVSQCNIFPNIANAGIDTTICLEDSLQLGTLIYLDNKYYWSNLEGFADTLPRPWVSPIHTTIYFLKQLNSTCQVTYDTITIFVKDCEPPANAGPDVTICYGDSIQLGSTNIPTNTYIWTNAKKDSIIAAQPWVKPVEPICYYLTQKDKYDTLTYDSICIFVEECLKPLVIPNVFTPNSDGINDNLEILNPGNHAYKITIFNRWGKIVFKGDETKAWDGKKNGNEVPDGVYYYQITAYLKDGREIDYTGVVHLMR